MAKILALIPARSGSKSIKDKNLLKINTLTLLEHSINNCIKSKFIQKIVVSTDSKKYAKIALNAGAEVPFLRPKKISKDNSHDKEFFYHALNFLKSKENYIPDFIVHIRPTTPLRKSKVIDEAINKFIKSKSFSSLRSVHEMSESSYKTFELENSVLKPLSFLEISNDDLNSPRQSFPKTYQANGYIDIISVERFLSTGQLHGNKVYAYVTEPVMEIDHINDYKTIKKIIRK